MPLLSASEVQHLIVNGLGIGKSGGFRVSHIGDGTATMIFDYHPTMLRPGGTISGPTLMLAADAVMYAAVLGHYSA
jgi:acyl-coenzyme A thioesterase PaaI-like protein